MATRFLDENYPDDYILKDLDGIQAIAYLPDNKIASNEQHVIRTSTKFTYKH